MKRLRQPQKPKLSTLDEATLSDLAQHCELQGQDFNHLTKIIQTKEMIYKFFPKKKLFSSDTLYPRAKRFLNNSFRLKQLGLNSVTVEAFYYLPNWKTYLIEYPPIIGSTMGAALLATRDHKYQLLDRLSSFIARLHQMGVYFRGLHLGNIIVASDRDFALIDIADIAYSKHPLSANKRVRNFRHLFHALNGTGRRLELEHLSYHDINYLITAYLQQIDHLPAHTTNRIRAGLVRCIHKIFPKEWIYATARAFQN